ncbi:MAG: acetyl-CoA carboxylase biotin carboxyl carrier protein [bacterium]|nr:acetyl-CoA carboxylase biotin carboxyl carrier protein [bacterium]
MKLETDYIEKLAKIINDNGLTEISLEEGDQAITIRKDVPEVVNMTSAQTVTPVQASNVVQIKDETIQKPTQRGKAITSPMVGTFYASTSPDSEPFVEVGSEIKQGDVVCIIEAMKLMNEIKSEHAGKVVQVCVKNGDPIEYGQVLMYVE